MLRTMALYSVDGAYVSLAMAWTLLSPHFEYDVRGWCWLGLWRGAGGVDMTVHWAGMLSAITPTCPHQMPQQGRERIPMAFTALTSLGTLVHASVALSGPLGSVCYPHFSRSRLLFPSLPQTVLHLSSPAAQCSRIHSPTLPLPGPLLSKGLCASLIG